MNNTAPKLFLYALPAAAVILAVALWAPGQASVTDQSAERLAPKAEHRYASRLATRFINGYHYHKGEFGDDLSDRIFKQYMSLLDGNRLYFTSADVADLERYRPHLHDALKSADLEPAYDIFNRYVSRVGERTDYALSLLDGGFDFSVEESYRFDRTDLPWAEDYDALNEVWRQRVKNDWLLLKLADQDDSEIVETLTERYTNLNRRISEFNSEDVFQFFMNAYTRSIEPHSAYMSPRSVDNFEISMRLSLDGIGAMLQRETEYTTVIEIVPGGPADMDGRLQSGDRIVGVAQDDEEMVDVVGWRLDDVVSLIRGERETTVRLRVLPAETGLSGPAQVIDIVRDQVRLEEQAANSEIIEVPQGDDTLRIGVVTVPVFYVDFQGRARNEPNYRSSTRDARRLINELKQEGIDGLMIDLRGNGGGALIEATTMTGLFIDEGPVVQVRDSQGRVNLERDREPGMAWEGPLAVLVDRRSASASEIFAGAIQDYGRGVIIGEHTFGKGTVQNLIDLDEFSRSDDARLGQIKLTMAQFYRIDGGSTQSRGVIPDIVLPTAGDPDEVGESALDYSLPWGEIEATQFVPVADLSTLIERARQRHESRLSDDEELRELMKDLDEWEKAGDHTAVSLHLETRRAEVDKAEQRRIARFGEDAADSDNDLADADADGEAGADDESAADEPERDLYRFEAGRIMADLIELDRDQHVLAHHANLDAGAALIP